MKNSIYKLLKVTLTVVLFTLSSKSYSQEKFDNDKLFILEKIALNTTPKNFKKYMKDLDYILYNENTDWCSYIDTSGDKVMLNTYNNQISSISMTEITAKDKELMELSLKEKKFIEVNENGGKRFEKKSYPFSFFIHEIKDCRTMITAYKL